MPNLSSYWDLAYQSYGSTAGAGQKRFDRSSVYIDDGWFDGTLTVKLRFVATNTDSVARTVLLQDQFNTDWVTPVSVPSGTSSRTLFESAAFTLGVGEKIYYLALKQTTSANQLQVYSADIVIVQVGATKTAQQYMLSSKGSGSGSNVDRYDAPNTTSIWSTNNTTYGDAVQAGRFLLTKANWETVSTWKFKSWVGSYTAVRIVDSSGNQVVEHSKPTSGSSFDGVDFSHDATNWDDGEVFRLQCKTTWGSSQTDVWQCYLVAIIDPIVRCEAYTKLDRSDTVVASVTMDYGRNVLRGFSSGDRYLIGTVQRSATEGAQTFYLFDAAAADSGTTGANAASSALLPTTTLTVTKGPLIDSGDVPDDEDRIMMRAEKTAPGDMSWVNVHLMTVVAGQISISVGDTYMLSGSSFGIEFPFIRRSGSDTWNWQDSTPTYNMSGFIRVLASGSYGWSDDFSPRMFNFIRKSGSDTMYFLTSDSASGSTASRFGKDVLVIGSVVTPVGTEYFSKISVRHPTRFYRGEVMSWGSINRSIPAPSGIPRVGNITVDLADTDLFWRQLFAQSSPKNRRIGIKLGLEGQSESQFLQVYEGQVTGTSYPPVQCQISAADITSDWFEEIIPALITKENFPNKRKGNMFAPIIFGEIISEDGQGSIPIFECDTVQNRLCVARHPVKSITLYRKRSLDKDAGFDTFANLDDDFKEVSPIFYNLVEEDITIDGVDYTFTFAEFNYGGWFMGKNTEWRMDCSGLTDDRTSTGNLEQNFSECIKAVLTEMGGKFGATTQDLDLNSFSVAAAALDVVEYKCDGAVLEEMTYYDLISRLVTSANLDFFQNISGQIALSFYQGNNSNRPEFTDLRDILIKSVTQSESYEAINKLKFFYSKNYAVSEENTSTTNQEEWGVEQVFNNDIDQTNTDKETEETFEFWFVRNANTADQVIADVASYLDQESFKITFETPGPLNVDRLELGKEIGITHYGGLESTGSGFSNEPFKVIGLDFNLDTFKYRVTAIRRVTPSSVNQIVNGEWAPNLRAGPWRVANGLFYGIFRDPDDNTRLKAMRTSNFGKSWAEMDVAGFSGLASTVATADSELQNTLIHVLTQDSSGKTEYHRFNTVNNTWDIYQFQVTANQAGVVNKKVSVTVLTGGSICAYYTTTGSGGGARASYRLINSSGTALLGSEVAITTAGRNDRRMTRVLAGGNNRAHFYYQGRGAFNDEYVVTLDASGTLGVSNKWWTGNLPYYTTSANNANMGFPAVVYSNNNQNATMYLPMKGHFGQPFWAEFDSKDNITTFSLWRFFSWAFVFEGNNNSATGHAYPAYSICAIDEDVYHIAALFPTLIGLNWEVYKKGTEGSITLDPPWGGAGCTDLTSEGSPYGAECYVQHKAGMSNNSAIGQTMQCSNSQMYKYGGKLYLMKFTGIGDGDNIAFQHLKVSEDIPVDISFDRAAFLASLSS